MKKAKLTVIGDDCKPVGGVRELEFHYNPTEYTLSKAADWTRKTKASAPSCAPVVHYDGVHAATVQMDILFDLSEKEAEADRDVSKAIQTLLDWTKPTTDTLKKGKKPWGPFLQLEWGSGNLTGFKCVLKSVTAKYLMFLETGVPVRATANISLEEIPDDAKRQNPTSGALHGRSTHTIADGDTLQSIAYREFGDPNLWRGLAIFNDLDDPLRIKPGRDILVPTPAEAARLSTEA